MFTQNSLSEHAMPETGVLPEGIILVIKESGSGIGHMHEDYWYPVDVDKVQPLRKMVKRKLKRPELQATPSMAE